MGVEPRTLALPEGGCGHRPSRLPSLLCHRIRARSRRSNSKRSAEPASKGSYSPRFLRARAAASRCDALRIAAPSAAIDAATLFRTVAGTIVFSGCSMLLMAVA